MTLSSQTLLDTPESFWNHIWLVNDGPAQIRVGDLELAICLESHEWQLFYQWDKTDSRARVLPTPTYTDLSKADKPNDRIVVPKLSPEVRLTPRLADRPIVVRPYSPLTLAADSTTTLYVTTPIWIAIELSGHPCKELPVSPLSDSWMGDLTGHGELCYGSKTHARLDKALMTRLPYRALTPIELHNKSDIDSRLERLSLPMPYLSVYLEEGQLVTEPLSMTMDVEKGQGLVHILNRPDDVVRLSKARKNAEKGILVNTLSNLFA